MRKFTLLFLTMLILGFIMIPTLAKANEVIDLYNADKCESPDFIDEDLSGYKAYQGKVYYFYCVLEGVDPATIKPLTMDGKKSVTYAQDKNNVYFQTIILSGLEPNQFKIKNIEGGGIILYDNNSIYFDGTEITDTNPDIATLEAVGDGYYRDKNNLYLQKLAGTTKNGDDYFTFKKIDGANPDNFETGYKITPDAVYWYGKKIEGADVGSMELLHFGFAKDKNNVFFEGKIVYGADVRSFVETAVGDVNYYVDKNGFFGDDDGQHYLTIPYMNKEYPKDVKITQKSLSSAIKDYETKYPNYSPQPAMPKPGSPEEQALKKFEADVAKAKLEAEANKQNMIKLGIIGLGSVLGLGGIVYRVMRWKKRKK